MTDRRLCVHCVYFKPVDDDDPSMGGWCRRHPPHELREPVFTGYGRTDKWGWPRVKADDWCGHWHDVAAGEDLTF